jgi:hypothetical protein
MKQLITINKAVYSITIKPHIEYNSLTQGEKTIISNKVLKIINYTQNYSRVYLRNEKRSICLHRKENKICV